MGRCRACWLLVPMLTGCAASPIRPDAVRSVEALRARVESQRLAAIHQSAPTQHRPGTCVLAKPPEGLIGSAHPVLLDDLPIEDSTQPLARDGAAGRNQPLPSFGATIARDVQSLPADLWADTRKVYTSPTNLLVLGLTYGGALASQETGPDDTVERSFQTHSTLSKEWRDAFGALGNPGTHFGVAGLLYLAGQQTGDTKTYRVSRELFSALAINGLSTLVGQAASWDESPNGEWGTFPSGHVSSTFALASVLHEEYGPAAGLPLYGLGALVGIERLEDGEHYLSDVLFGGVLGLVVGHTVARDQPIELFGGTIIPYVDPQTQSTGVAWHKPLKD